MMCGVTSWLVVIVIITSLSVLVVDSAKSSPYTDGHVLDPVVKKSQFLWMRREHTEKEIDVPGHNSSQEFTLFMNMEGLVIPPFSGNITTTAQKMMRIVFNDETTTELVISQESPWRKVLMYMEVTKDKFLNCDLDFRLHSNTTYNFVIQGFFHEHETIILAYINGKLQRKCRHDGPSYRAEERVPRNNLLRYNLENKDDAVIRHHQVVYWSRALSYHEIQQISLVEPYASYNNQMESLPLSTSTWYQEALRRYPAGPRVDDSACTHEEIAVILYPGFYSARATNKIQSIEWLQKHILESVRSVLHSINLCGNGKVDIIIPLSVQHRKQTERYVIDKIRLPSEGVILEFHTIPLSLKPIYQKLDNLTVSYSFAAVANNILEHVASSRHHQNVQFIAVLSSYIYPEKNWLVGLVEGGISDGSADVVGGKIVHMSGALLHYGYELLELSYNGGLEVLLTPHNMYRGYWATDKRTHGHEKALAVSRDMMLFNKAVVDEMRFRSDRGFFFDEEMSPMFEDVDMCLRARAMGFVVHIAGEAVGTSTKALYMYDEDELSHLTSSLFNPLQMKPLMLHAFQTFSRRWKAMRQQERQEGFLTPAKLTWIIHCGGSQGLEAATILQTLYKYLDVRTLIRRYSFCEHSDTLSGMPAFFKDILDYTAYRSFTKPYRGFSKLSEAVTKQEEESLNRTVSFETLRSGDEIESEINSQKLLENVMHDESDFIEDGSIVLYARDYREMGRWLPRDTSYFIGRYMYETDSLPRPWVNHCNQLDEVWVPSKWQFEAFESAGVKPEKMHVMGETVDEYFFDPHAVQPLALPGTVLDGHPPPSAKEKKFESTTELNPAMASKRPFAFCSVFKMEDRKGYKELVEGFIKEFHDNPDVVLVLRTYIHSGHGIADENFSPYLIRKEVDDHLTWRGLPLSRRNVSNSTRIEIVSEHLPTKELVSLYSSCDAFVLPTHAEGWGLPTHEAMIMGLPVITTNFGGSTEFVTKESGFLINVSSLIPTTGDEWLKGGNWAAIDIHSLQELMRKVYLDRTSAVEMGQKGKRYVENFSPDSVAKSYADRIATIYNEILPAMKRERTSSSLAQSRSSVRGMRSAVPQTSDFTSHGERVGANLDIQFGQTGRFKTCSIRSYKRIRPRNYPAAVVGGVPVSHVASTALVCDFVIISTWAPRLCGIATFSSALRDALLEACPPGSRVDVVAVKHRDQPNHEYNYSEVKKTFVESEPMSYVSAAQFINNNQYHTALIQYEFGMLYGDHLTCLLRELKSPRVFTTIHTVKINYQDNLQAWVQQANFMSDRLVVMTHSMRHILNSFLAIPTRDVAVIPHGGPNLPYNRLDGTEFQHFFKGKKVILSNGLIHPMKGLELMIWAMKQVLEVIPDAVYLIHGKPHPSGVGCEEYYAYIQEEANNTAPNHIFFNNSFASTEDLHLMLRSASVYVNAYTDREQSVSGTLAMALGLGTVAVSTPYAYAAEVLQNNSGRLVPFNDVDALAEAVIDVLSDDENRKTMSRSAFAKAQEQKWDNVAKAYIQLSNSS